MKVQEWWYAVCVCRKYKIKWNPFSEVDVGYYHWSGIVQVNPFDPNFLSIFLHEVGHHVHNKRVGLKSFLRVSSLDEPCFSNNKYDELRSIYRTLDSEAIASRFAVKTGKADKAYLLKCFNTYSASIFKSMDKSVVVNKFADVVDCVYKNIRRIEK